MADYDIGAAFEAIEEELISSMIRNFKRHRAEETAYGFQWSQWQADQLDALETYRRRNQAKFGKRFQDYNQMIEAAIQNAYEQGGADQEEEILEAIRLGASLRNHSDTLGGAFFHTNERKLNALIQATTGDMERAEIAVLRRANDAYRKTIFNAQVYANTGAGTYEKAVDMATRDFLAAGIRCVVYKNGAQHTLADYADMAIRTASKRAYLQGEGAKRQEWGVSTVIINRRNGACPECARYCGKVFIDDVWSGGKRSDGNYPLLSSAVAGGLYHPRCKDSHSTYFPELYEEEEPYTPQEIAGLKWQEKKEQWQQYVERQAKKYDRMARFSLDPENQRKYQARAEEWNAEVRVQAEQAAAKMGVYADYSDFAPDLAEAVNQSIADVQEMFGPLTKLKGVRSDNAVNGAYSSFDRRTEEILLKNTNVAGIMETMRKDAAFQRKVGGWSSGDSRHAIVHEIGHALGRQHLTPEKRAELEKLRRAEVLRVTGNADTDLRDLDKVSAKTQLVWGDRAKSDLSLYGLTSVDEMVAESLAQNILDEPGKIAQQVILILME